MKTRPLFKIEIIKVLNTLPGRADQYSIKRNLPWVNPSNASLYRALQDLVKIGVLNKYEYEGIYYELTKKGKEVACALELIGSHIGMAPDFVFSAIGREIAQMLLDEEMIHVKNRRVYIQGYSW